MALLKLDLHLFHKDARQLSLIVIDPDKDVTVQHVLNQITNMFEIPSDDESSGIALFSEGFFVHPSLPSTALLALPGILLVRPVRVVPEASLDGKRGKKRRIELLHSDLESCASFQKQHNGVDCTAGKQSNAENSSTENGNEIVMDVDPPSEQQKKKRKKCKIDTCEVDNEGNLQLHSTPKVISKDDLILGEPTVHKKSKKKKRQDVTNCDETVEEIELTVCDYHDESWNGKFRNEKSDGHPKRRSKKKNLNERIGTSDNHDESWNGKFRNEKSDGHPKRRSKKKNLNERIGTSDNVSMNLAPSIWNNVDEDTEIENPSVIINKNVVQQQEIDVTAKSFPTRDYKCVTSCYNGTSVPEKRQEDEENTQPQQINGCSPSFVVDNSVAVDSDHSSASSGRPDVSSNRTDDAGVAATNKRKRKRKHNKRLKREKERLRAVFLGDGIVEMPDEQQYQRQTELKEMEVKYLKRGSTMLANNDKDNKMRLEYEAQLKCVPKLKQKNVKVKIIEDNKFKKEKCGIVTFQGQKTMFNKPDEVEVVNNIDNNASVTVSTDVKPARPHVSENVSEQPKIKSTVEGFLERRLQRTTEAITPILPIRSDINAIANSHSQRDLQIDNLNSQAPRNDHSESFAMKALSPSSINPPVEISRLPSDVLLMSGNRLPTSMEIIRKCFESSAQSAEKPVPKKDPFKMLHDRENAGEVSVFTYDRRGCAPSSKQVCAPSSKDSSSSEDELSDSSSDDSFQVAMPRRKKADDGAKFPFRAPPNPTPFPPTSDEVRGEFFCLSAIEDPIEPLVYYRCNAYEKDVVDSNPPCKKEQVVEKGHFGDNSTSVSEEIAATVSKRNFLYKKRSFDISVSDEVQKQVESSASSGNVSVAATIHEKETPSRIPPSSPCETKISNDSVVDPPCLNSVENAFNKAPSMTSSYHVEQTLSSMTSSNHVEQSPFSTTKSDRGEQTPSPITSSNHGEQTLSSANTPEIDAIADIATVHTGTPQCLQPIKVKQSKGFKPRVYSALGSLLQQLRNKNIPTEQSANDSTSIVERDGKVNDEVLLMSSGEPKMLVDDSKQNKIGNRLDTPDSSIDNSTKVSCHNTSSCSNGIDIRQEKTNYPNGVSKETRLNDKMFAENSNLGNSLSDVLPKRERGKRTRKRKGKDAEKLQNSEAPQNESFLSNWDVTPEEYTARQFKKAPTSSFDENDVRIASRDFKYDISPSLPSVLSNINVDNLPELPGMPHVGDIVFFYIDDACLSSSIHHFDNTVSMNGSKKVKSGSDGDSSLNISLRTSDVNTQQTCPPSSNGDEHQLVPVVGKVLTVVEDEEVTLQLIGNSGGGAPIDDAELPLGLTAFDGTSSNAGFVELVSWSNVFRPKLIFP